KLIRFMFTRSTSALCQHSHHGTAHIQHFELVASILCQREINVRSGTEWVRNSTQGHFLGADLSFGSCCCRSSQPAVTQRSFGSCQQVWHCIRSHALCHAVHTNQHFVFLLAIAATHVHSRNRDRLVLD